MYIMFDRSGEQALYRPQLVHSYSSISPVTSGTYSQMLSFSQTQEPVTSTPLNRAEPREMSFEKGKLSMNTSDIDGFKIPTLPPPKKAVFSKSTGKK